METGVTRVCTIKTSADTQEVYHKPFKIKHGFIIDALSLISFTHITRYNYWMCSLLKYIAQELINQAFYFSIDCNGSLSHKAIVYLAYLRNSFSKSIPTLTVAYMNCILFITDLQFCYFYVTPLYQGL